MALRRKIGLSVIGALVGSMLAIPSMTVANAATETDDADRVTLIDGAPASTTPQAEIGTRSGPAAALDSDLPQRPLIDPEVSEAAAEDERVPVIVRLRNQADLASLAASARLAAARGGEAARAETVVETLQATAEATQGDVRNLLTEINATDVESYWIFNGFAATIPADQIDELAAHPDVQSITLDEELTLPEVEESEPRLPTWGLEHVHAPEVWGDYGFTGEGVVVGIMDGGVDGSHPALADRYRGRNGDHEHSWFAATGENYPTPGDGHGHGTHVAGTILGGPPGEVTGVAPDAEWIAAKIFRDSGTTSTSIIHAGFQWMLAPGGDPAMAPDVVNNSWGSDATFNTEFWEDVNAWVAAGVFPNFAAGNAGPGPGTVGSPASFPQSFAVGATDINDQIAAFSSRGPVAWDGVEQVKPQVSAPGQDIFSTWPLALDPDGYNTISGTSMATPHVTGVIALLLEAEPDLSVNGIREVLTSTARVEPHMGAVPNNNYGSGIVDASAAIVAARFSGTIAGTIRGPDGPVAATVSVADLGVSTVSDPTTGFYELRLREGTWPIKVEAYGYVGETKQVSIAAGDRLVLDVTLDTAAVHTISGTVTSGGSPLADASIRVADAPLPPAYSAGDGSFSLQVAAGTYEISAQATGYQRVTRTITIDADAAVNFDLPPLGAHAAEQWVEYQNNPRRTGHSADQLAPDALTQRWQTRVSGRAMFSSPVVADGRIYLATDAGRLFAMDADDGSTLWSFTAGANFRTTPAVADGRVYFGGGDDGMFYALDAASGQPLWTYPTGDRLTYTTPTVVDGTVYFGTGWGTGDGGWIYALDAATGTLRWRTFIGAQVFFAPAVADGTVFAGSYDARRLVALDAATGAEKWALTRDNDGFAAMPTYADGVVYVGTNNFDTGVGSILAVDAGTGALLWEASGHGDASGSAPIVNGNLVIAGSNQNNWVAAYDRATGARRWVSPIGAAVSNGQMAADGVIVGGSQQDHRAWALDAYTGAVLWDVTLADNILAAPAYADGRLVVAARNGQVTTFEAPGTVSGVVRDSDGNPLTATIRIAAPGQQHTGEGIQTDPATGAYSLDARAGTYVLEVTSYGYQRFTADINVRSGRTITVDATLSSGGTGSLAGTITDADGNPLAGVSAALFGTPLEPAVSDDDGRYEFGEIAEGGYELTATLNGYVPFTTTVTIAADEQTRVDISLVKYQIAVTGDYQGELTRLLTQSGYTVESTTIAAIADRPGDYSLVVANGAQDDPGQETFLRFVENADAAGTSVIFLDTWGIGYGSLLHLSRYTGDPAQTGSGYNDGEVSVIARAGHPLTAGLTPGSRVPLLTADREYAWFADYSGRSVADLYVGDFEVTGSAIGYQPRNQESVHVLLSAHGVSPWSGPGNGWLPAAHTIFNNAVAYALEASFGTVTGRVTDATTGDPLAATVTVVETGERARAAADGSYSLLLPAGDYTLRVTNLGYASRDVPVTVGDRETSVVDVALAASGLGTIAGTVSSGGEPVDGATVSVVGTELSATSEADGTFTISDVPGGTYDLRATAAGYVTTTVPNVAVVDGEVTNVAVEMRRALRVAVVGDGRDVVDNEITTFLNANDMVATATGWEALDDLDSYDVVVFADPTDPGEAAFREALDKLDAAGISGVFIEGAFSSDGGVRLLRNHLGNPTGRDFVSSDGNPLMYPVDPDHPIFAGLPNPVQVLIGDEWGGFFTGYTGFKLADFGTDELGALGFGAAYEPRTPTSVRLLLSGLSVSTLASPSDGWTEDGKQVFLNALQWAAAPGMGGANARVTNAAEEPVAGATATIVETGVTVSGSDQGTFTIAHPPGTYTLEVSAFGYVTHQQPITFSAGRVSEISVELALGDVGNILGMVVDRETGAPLSGATVELDGFPRSAVTGEDGRFVLPHVEAGSYALIAEVDGHVRQRFADVEVAGGADTTVTLALRPSPTVAVIDDYEGRAKAYLAEWGYVAEDLSWTDTSRVDAYDLIIANLASFPRHDPGDAGLAAFRDAADRAHVPIVWLDQFGRGSIRWLSDYEGDPQTRVEDRSDGTVDARILVDHPLVDGFDIDSLVPLTAANREYTFFTGYSGVTVANLVTGAQGERGGTIAYRGRTSESVDILLSTLSISIYGYPPIDGQPGLNWTPQAEVLFHNALNWALDAPPLAAEARGAVRSSATGQPISSTITVVETGETFSGRAGDGTYLVPLQPGTWTLQFTAFGHEPATRTVQVAAGEVAQVDVTLTAQPVAQISGTVTNSSGAPVADATVSLEDTPLSTTTAADGTYALSNVPAADYTLRVQAGGYGVQRIPVNLSAGEAAHVDVTLEPSAVVAVAGDYQNSITAFLTANGYEVRQWSWSDVQNHIGELNEVGLVVLNGNGTAPTAAELLPFLDAAADAEVSVIMAGQWGSGAILAARNHRGDPTTVTSGFTASGVGITYRPTVEHPIFAGFPVGEPILLMRHPTGASQQWQWFSGYSGETIAAVGDENLGDLGGGVGYKFTSPTSVELLLDSLGAAVYGRPGERWTADAEQIYLNAVAWALDVTQASITGSVTDSQSGAPISGAEVRAVEVDASVVTGTGGTYQLGLPDGTHTVRVSAFGYEPFETTVTVGEGETVTLDVALVPLVRGAIAGMVTAPGGEPIAGARIDITGPQGANTVTETDGSFLVDDLVPGDYTVRVTADHHVTAVTSATVAAGETTTLSMTLTPNNVAVLGDVAGTLTSFLLRNGIAAEQAQWSGIGDDVERYDVIIVNGGRPSEGEFDDLIAAADDAGTSLVFTGTWGVDNGGIRVLERFSHDVVVGDHGYRDGAVGLAGFDPSHPLFAGITDPSAILAPDSYWSDIETYVGPYAADLTVGGSRRGAAVAYDFRTARSVHLLLSIGAVSDLIGPGYGWTADTERLMLNAVSWAADVQQQPPAQPTLSAPPSPISTPTVTLTGSAEFRSTVTIYRDGDEVATVTPDRLGTFSVDVSLDEGVNTFRAVAANFAGASTPSDEVQVVLDTTGPVITWSPQDHDGFFEPTVTVEGTVTDEHSGVVVLEVNGHVVPIVGDGKFALAVDLHDGQNEIVIAAIDGLGNKTTESRVVRYFPYDAQWQFAGTKGQGAVVAFLEIHDEADQSLQVDDAMLVVRDADGEVVREQSLIWDDRDERYHATIHGLDPGAYSFWAELDVDGWHITSFGGVVMRP